MSIYDEQSQNNSEQISELSDYAFNLINTLQDADKAINEFLAGIGVMYRLDDIVIKEVSEDGDTVRCTYEWSRSGDEGSLHLERRFMKEIIKSWQNLYESSESGVYVFRSNERRTLRLSMINADAVRSLVEVPMFIGGRLIGAVDFIDYDIPRVWKPEDIEVLKSIGRIIVSYFFSVRTADASKLKLREFLAADKVTKLPKYEGFIGAILQAMKSDEEACIAVCCADFSNFKYINEKYGYEVGDEVLILFARTVYGHFMRTVSCCREYSDNFCIAVKIPNEMTEERLKEDFNEFAELIIRQVTELLPDSNPILQLGICVLENGDLNIDQAVTNANAARKYARLQRHGIADRVAVFKQSMVQSERRDVELVSELQDALDNNEFKVFYQPKIDSTTGEVVGGEALVRWQKPDGKFIFPDTFIPAFERDGCIVKVDYRVYELVFDYLKRRIDAGLKVVPISMNVSRIHLFGREFTSYVDSLCDKYRIPANLLEFEITESVYTEELPMLEYTVRHLNERGISVSIDDFGSGYSSLDILTRLPFDVVKLDRIFMKENMSQEDRIIVGTIIDMARMLGIRALCEGVENTTQRDFLSEAGCDMQQGYLFSKPIPENQFSDILNQNVRY